MKAGFKVKALSDLILIASSNTEGNIKYLDYIPGSVFMGIAANKKFDLRLIDGSVRFSDADILINAKPSFKIPLSFHYQKDGKKNEIFNSHFLTYEDYKKEQFKQVRSGYMNNNKEMFEIEFNYSQKSARDNQKGRSAKSQMFGFKSIPKGSEFYFTLRGENIEDIIKILEGEHYIGKSKRSEYGKIKIVRERLEEDIKTEKSSKTYIYCKSRVALIDENGNPTYGLEHIHPGIKKENIVYDECKIRTYEYAPYNFKRGTWDSQRCVIEKGSVIVLENVNENIIKEIQKGIGGYLSEGFGEVLVNPWFLYKKSLTLTPYEPQRNKDKVSSGISGILLKRKEQQNRETEMLLEVYSLINDYTFTRWFYNISPSQWGNIRKLTQKRNYYDEIESYITTGVKKWREDQSKKFLNVIKGKSPEFVKFLAMQMANKIKRSEK